MSEQSEHDRLWGAAALAALRAFDAVIEINSVGVVSRWNERAEQLFGLRHDETTGETSLGDLVVDANRFELDTAILAAHDSADTTAPGWQGQLDLVRANGLHFRGDVLVIPGPAEIAGSALLVVRAPAVADLDATSAPNHAPRAVAHAEPGGLVSVDVFTSLLDEAFARDRSADASVAVLRIALDLAASDEHTSISDYSVEACRALCRVAGSDGVVTAINGSGFAMLLDPLVAPYFAANMAERIANDFRDRLDGIEGARFSTVSIGIGFLDDEHVSDADDIVRHADAALARAQEQGGDRCEIFDDKLRDDLGERRRFRDELYAAIDAGDFRVHYQPANDLIAERITMVEALVRWDHPTRGLVAAGEFVQLAEETGLILPLGAWVLNEACRQLGEWLDLFGDSAPVVAINFSPHQLHHPTAVQLVAGVIEANGLDARRLCIEITESTLMADPDAAIARLAELQALGVSLSIDHFGADRDSAARLRSFPVDLVKIDRSIINELTTSDHARAAAAVAVDTARELGVTVAAEGVETADQYEAVRELGCEQVQGFFVARPQSPEDISGLVNDELAGRRST